VINPADNLRDLYTCLTVATSDCESVLDLCCGFGEKLACTRAGFRVGVDIHKPYLDVACKKWGNRIYFVWEDALSYAFSCAYPFDGILLIDAIEHLEKQRGLDLISRCQEIAKRRLIVFTPEGVCPQDHDTYEMGGDYAQTHKSTWTAEEMRTLGFKVALWENWHPGTEGTFFAIWEP